MRYCNYTEEQIKEAVKENISAAGALRKLGLKPIGGNYKTLKNKMKQLGCDSSHWKGQGYLKGKTNPYSLKKPLSEILIENSLYSSTTYLKSRLIKENIIIEKCSNCGLKLWLGNPISLHLDHINGINSDNRLDNLRLLCPNCHSQTPTYCGKKLKGRTTKAKICYSTSPESKTRTGENKNEVCIDCKRRVYPGSQRCKKCSGIVLNPPKVAWPPVEVLKEMVSQTSWSEAGRQLGVSDNAVRKHIKKHYLNSATGTTDRPTKQRHA